MLQRGTKMQWANAFVQQHREANGPSLGLFIYDKKYSQLMIVSVFDDGKRDTGYPNLKICILTCL